METWALNNTLDQNNLIDIYRIFHPKAAEYTFFSSPHRTFSKINQKKGHKTSFGKFLRIEITYNIFSDHRTMRLEISYKKTTAKKHKHVEAKNMLLNNQ